MRLTELAVGRPQFTFVMLAMTAALGLHSLLGIPRAEDPSYPAPIVAITAVFPGASPRDMEEIFVDPLEDRLGELSEIKRIDSTAEAGVAKTVVEFLSDSDPDRKYEEVVREVNGARGSFPEGLQRLDVKKFEMASVAILQLALVSEEASYRTLERVAERIQDRLQGVSGVRDVETWAFPESRVWVDLDPEKLARLRLPLGRLFESLQGGSQAIPAGAFDLGRRRFSVEAGGAYRSLEDVRSTAVASDGERLVTVAEVAHADWGYAEETYRGRVDGRRAVFLTVTQRENENVFRVRDGVMGELERLRPTLPASIEIEVCFDQSSNVARRLSHLTRDFAVAIGLVLVTLVPLGLRASLIVMTSIPLSLAIGLAILNALGYTLNQISIVGFVIALGLLVDDSIVVVENVTRFLRMGYAPIEAAIRATRQISAAVLGCTATLMLAFLPLLFLTGGSGHFIRCLPLAVFATVGASLLVSLTVIPFLASRVLSRSGSEGNAAFRTFQAAIEAAYRPLLRVAIARPRSTLAGAALLFVGALALAPQLGFQLFPKADLPQFRVLIELPEGSPLAETDRAARFAEGLLIGRPGIAKVVSNVGHGNPQIYYNVSASPEKTHLGELFVRLDRYDPERTPLLLEGIRRELAAYVPGRLRLEEFENGPPIGADIQIRVQEENLEELRAAAARVEQVIEETEGTYYVDNPLRLQKTHFAVRIDSAEAGRLGVGELDVKRAVRLAVTGLTAGQLRDAEGKEHEIWVRLDPGRRSPLEAINELIVSSASGAQVPLRQLAALELQSAPASIEHYAGTRSVTVSADVRRGYDVGSVTHAVLDRLMRESWAPGTSFDAGGELESQREIFEGFGTASLVAAFGVLAVLVLEFGTFKSTLIVASVIPLGVVGAVGALFLAGYPLSFTALVGLIALIGIEVKNSVLLVDFTNQLRAAGMGLDEAIESAGQTRFFPILLTTLTALGGLMPLALERSSLYSPLAIVIMGGLTSSTLLARFVTPVAYKLLPPAIAAPPALSEPAAMPATGLQPA